MADGRLDALRSSVRRLDQLASPLTEADLTVGAYPSEWTVADVLSHLGSGAIITRRRLDDALAGRSTPDDVAAGVWDEWNAKGPVAQRTDALDADAALLDALDAVTAEQRRAFTTTMGPMSLDFDQFVGMRLNEHALHTWDIETVGDTAATLPPEVVEHVVDNLDLIARFTARPTGDIAAITVTTTEPARGFTIALGRDAVSLTPGSPSTAADLELPSEAFARLIYRRLDPDHTPPGSEAAPLELLRKVFPGP